jgi:transcriptional regulator with XRE-family HTH domain
MKKKINQLNYYRLERKLNQYELAFESGVPRSTIQLYEDGHKLPSASHRDALAAALDVTVMELFGDDHTLEPIRKNKPSADCEIQLELDFNPKLKNKQEQ